LRSAQRHWRTFESHRNLNLLERRSGICLRRLGSAAEIDLLKDEDRGDSDHGHEDDRRISLGFHKQEPADDLRMKEADFDQMMRGALGASPPENEKSAAADEPKRLSAYPKRQKG